MIPIGFFSTFDVVAFDLETIGVDPRKESPVNRGQILWVALSVNTPEGIVTEAYRWSDECADWFRAFSGTLVAHGYWTFDRHLLLNLGIETTGICSLEYSRFQNPGGENSLKGQLKAHGIEPIDYNLLVKAPGIGVSKTRNKVTTNPDGTVIGTASTNVCWGRPRKRPLEEVDQQKVYTYVKQDAWAINYLHKSYEKFPSFGKIYSDIERRGIAIDRQYAEKLLTEYSEEIPKVKARLDTFSGGQVENWNSSTQVSEFLYSGLSLAIPEVVGSGTAPQINREKKRSTSALSLQWLVDTYNLPGLQDLIELRRLQNDIAKIQSYLDHDRDGRVYTQISGSTATGRTSSKNPALQQVSVGPLRDIFVGTPRLHVADYSQLELYVLGWYLAELFSDTRLLGMLCEGDVHSGIAKMVWPELAAFPGDLRESGHGKERSLVKSVVYSMNYGKTAASMGATVKGLDGKLLGRKRAKALMQDVAEATGSDRWAKYITEFNRKHSYVETYLKRRRYGLNDRQALNTPIQGTAADVMNIALKRLQRYKPILQVHDEVLLDSESEDYSYLEREMRSVLPGVTIPVQAGCYRSWGEAK